MSGSSRGADRDGRKVIQRRVKADEFRLVDHVSIDGSSLSTSYSRPDVIRFFYPDFSIRENDFIEYREFLTSVVGRRKASTAAGIRGVLAVVRLFKQRRQKLTPGSKTVTALPPPLTPPDFGVGDEQSRGGTTPIARTPPGETEFIFEKRDVVLKIGDDIDIENELRVLTLLERELIVTASNPHVSKTFKSLKAPLDEKLLNEAVWGKFSRGLEMMRTTSPVGVSGDDSGRIFTYIMTEYSTRGDLYRVSRGNTLNVISLHEARSWFFQMAFSLQRLHHRGMIHRDLSSGNVTITENRTREWSTQYSLFSGQIDDDGVPLYDFFDPYIGDPDNKNKIPDIVKIIDFESLRRSDQNLPVRRPTTTLSSRPPEQLLASMRIISNNAPDDVLSKHTPEGDLFALGTVAADLYLRSATGQPWSLLFNPLNINAGTDPILRSIDSVIDNFQAIALESKRRGNLPPGQAAVRRWTVEEPRLLTTYVRNLVYLAGAPRQGDLTTIGFLGENDFLWKNLFDRFDKNAPPQLPILLRNAAVPEDAIEAISSLWRWNPRQRSSAINLLQRNLFRPFFRARSLSRAYAQRLVDQGIESFFIFGDRPFQRFSGRLTGVSDKPIKRPREETTAESDDAGQRRRTQAPRDDSKDPVLAVPLPRPRGLSATATDVSSQSYSFSGARVGSFQEATDSAYAVKVRDYDCETNDSEKEEGEIAFGSGDDDDDDDDDEQCGQVHRTQRVPDVPYISKDTYDRLLSMQSDGEPDVCGYVPLSSVNPTIQRCAHCLRAIVAGGKCGRCHSVYYCSDSCQLYHWHYEHKFACSSSLSSSSCSAAAATSHC